LSYISTSLHGKADGVFPHFINKAAFFDKVELAVWGSPRRRVSGSVILKPSQPIGGPNRPYGRSVHGKFLATANPFEFRYGKIQNWANLSPFRLIVRSHSIPLTGIQVDAIAHSLFRKGLRAQVGLVEMTFDIEGYSVHDLRMHFLTRCTKLVELKDKNGWGTLYIGSRRSPWQLRIYQKAESVVRVEYIFRREFLRSHAMSSCMDLLRLRQFDLFKLVAFQEFSQSRLNSMLKSSPDFWGKELLHRWPHRWPVQTLTNILHWRGGIDPGTVLQPFEAERLFGRMQRYLLW